MTKFVRMLRNNLAFVATKAIDKRVDGREIGKGIDQEMDKALGKKSEKIQRGPMTNLLLEILEGLWNEEPNSLRLYLQERYFQDAPRGQKSIGGWTGKSRR